MYSYKISIGDSDEKYVEFESESFLPEMQSEDVNGATVVFFLDAGVGINLNEVRGVEIDGQSYKLNWITS